MGTDGIFKLA